LKLHIWKDVDLDSIIYCKKLDFQYEYTSFCFLFFSSIFYIMNVRLNYLTEQLDFQIWIYLFCFHFALQFSKSHMSGWIIWHSMKLTYHRREKPQSSRICKDIKQNRKRHYFPFNMSCVHNAKHPKNSSKYVR